MKRALSIHVQGLEYDVKISDGAYVGMNPNSTTRNEINYCWYASKEGVYLFSDMGDTRSSEKGTNIHGLFGAIIVEPAESFWLNPETGEPLESGLFADVYAPGQSAFREYAVFFHDELEIKDKDGNPPMDHRTGLMSATTGISYRSEPMRNRHPLTDNPADSGEDVSMSSWTYGDPATHVLPAYVGDPTKIRLLHGGIKETHVFHLHNHQWRLEADNPNSTILDSITLGPQECYTLDILHGAGSLNGMIGDAIFHCHLYPHFHEGMWSLLRVFDRLQDGKGKLPNGTPIPRLIPLKDRICPPSIDYEHPGYPNFINGQVGAAPFQPPFGIIEANGDNKIEPTPLEEDNFVENFAPGALYTDTCPCHTDNCQAQVKVFELALIQAKVTYNSYGWHDPQGRFFVRKEELEKHGGLENYICKVECGQIQAEPLVIRANAGDWIEVTLHNMLGPEGSIPYFAYPSVPLDQFYEPSMRVSLNPQFLQYDAVNDSGINVGLNQREQTVGPGESKTYLWYADQEYGSCILQSFGDMRNHRYHGLFGALIVEPPGAEWYQNGRVCKGSSQEQAVITAPGIDSFREFVVFIQNGIRLLDAEGELIKTAQGEGFEDDEVEHEDTGEKGYNYRSERFANRLNRNNNIEKVFSSRVHGDPATPIFQAHSGDRVIFRTVMAADKPRNTAFAIHGHMWKEQPKDFHSRVIPLQGGISIGNRFDMELLGGASCPGDYLYRSGVLKWDLESGMWGIFRVAKQSFGTRCKKLCRRVTGCFCKK